MKRILSIIAVAFSVILLSSLKNSSSAQAPYEDDISYQTFYDELDPYGEWIDYPEYGYVWVPDCGPDFRPYSTNGHWAWSDEYEWIWVSDYDWGWAPFHYGRWNYDSFHGWMWIPGYEWSPAWVAWRGGGDYYGWAPLRPGINISVNFSIGSYNPPVDYWCFAPRRYITSPRIYDYYVPYRNNVTIINNTTIINNYNYNRNVFRTGPGRRDVERYAGRINPVRLRESNSPGRTRFSNNEVSVYRPRVRQDNNRSIAPRQLNRNSGNAQNNRSIIRRNENGIPRRNEEINMNTNRNNEGRSQNNNNRATDRRREVISRKNNQSSNNEGRNRRIERQPGNNDGSIERNERTKRQLENQNNNRRIERRDISRGNNNPQANNEQRARPLNRNNSERQMNSNRTERRNNINRNEIRNNSRSQQQPSRQFNNQRAPSQRFENRRIDNNNQQRNNNSNNRERQQRRR